MPAAASPLGLQSGYRIHAFGHDPTWEDFPIPSPGQGEVLVRVEACGVGLTVLNCINGDLAADPVLLPRVPGHEIAGTVVEVGEGSDPGLTGQRIVAYFYLSCGTCSECRSGESSRCSRLAGWVGVHRDGGYAPWAVLPTLNIIPVPPELDPVAATVVPDAVATPVHVAGRAAIGKADRVVVLGAGGGVGIHMVQVARLSGAQVAGFDITTDKLAEVERYGGRPVDSSDFSQLDPTALFPEGRPTVVVDFLGAPNAIRWAIEALGPGGRLVALTTFRERPLSLESRELVFGELSLLGSRYARKSEVAEAARLVASGAISPVIGAVVGPDGIPGLHDLLRSGELVGRGALDWRGENS